MKKKKVIAVLLVASTLMLSGCDKNAVPSGSAKTQSDSAENNGQENGELQDAAENGQETDNTGDANVSGDAGETADAAASAETVSSDNPNYLSYPGEKYTWNEITINIPENWADKYIIEEDEDGFSIYHKASDEKEKGYGYLCSVRRSAQWMNYGIGEKLLAYTDDGTLYYMIQPTDVTGYMDDEQVFAEFSSLAEDVPMLATSIEINASNCHYDAEQYMIPVSNILPITREDLVNMSDNELWIARNEIFARHGRKFLNDYLQNYFDSCSWYVPVEDKVDEGLLNQIEKDNLDLIIAMEEEFAAEHPYPKEYQTGKTVKEDIDGDGSANSIMYQVAWQGEDYGFNTILTIDNTEYNLNEYVYMDTPVDDVFYITDLEEDIGEMKSTDGYEIAVLDLGPSYDPITYFFKYDGDLHYIGEVNGFPFKEQSNGVCGFIHYGGIVNRLRMDMIETTYLNGYSWYNSSEGTIETSDGGLRSYQGYKAHNLYVDLPVYFDMDEKSPTRTITAGQTVYFLESDMEEWILLRAKDGTSGYIRVQDGNVLNVGASADEVFSDLDYFD